MDFVSIRKNLSLSQAEMALLFGVAVATLKNWEQGRRTPDNSALTLYKLVESENQAVLEAMMTIACNKRYTSLKEVQILKGMVGKVDENKNCRALFQKSLLENNRHFTPFLGNTRV